MLRLSERVLSEAKSRFAAYLIAIFLIWPLTSTIMGTLYALTIPYFTPSLWQALLFSFGGMTIMLPDILVVGSICLLFCLALFSLLASLGFTIKVSSKFGLIVEPTILFFAAIFGASLYYPAVLSFPVFSIFGLLPIWVLTSMLACLMIGWCILLSTPGHRLYVVITILAFSVVAPLPVICRNQMIPKIPSPSPTVLLGIDSLSFSDNLSHIRHWTQTKGGAWYAKAVSPGLLTNPVWTSILLMEPVHEHGVFHVFQSRPDSSSESLIASAKKHGYYTVSFFSDQLTCWIGGDYAFDQNRSGPMGWRQLSTIIYEDSSILLPLWKPVLPNLPFSSVPPNHAGVYTYSIERELSEVLSQPPHKKGTLVVGHSTYLHIPSYPKYSDLSWDECKRVLRSQAFRIMDRSFDWQDVDRPKDPIPLRHWKVQRIQTAITEAMEWTGFLQRGGRMILFSDHGDRAGISPKNLHEERYYHVMFATFGLPVRELNEPISTMDSGSILGLAQNGPFDPSVEFAISEPSEWPLLVNSSKLNWDGRVHLNREMLANIFKRLQSYSPWVDRTKL